MIRLRPGRGAGRRLRRARLALRAPTRAFGGTGCDGMTVTAQQGDSPARR